MAFTLIDLLTEEFDPGKYSDEYREALMQVIEAKLEGQEVEALTAPRPAKVMDLMSALKASVAQAKKSRGEEEAEEEEEKPVRRRRAAAG